MKFLLLFLMVLILASPALALAQDEAEPTRELTILERAQKAAELIQASQEARTAGIPEEEVKEVLESARDRGLTPEETEEVLSESTAAVEESGPVDNFGAFVQTRLDEGLRGKELAAAIHEEHKLHGKGKGHGKDKSKGHGHSHDKQEMKKNKKDHPSEADGHHHGDDENDSEDHEDHEGHDEDDHDKQDGKGNAKKKGK